MSGGKNCERYRDKVILAPMVKIGTLSTRLLALKYGADLVYTEEIIDWRILRAKRIVNELLGTVEYIDPRDETIVFNTSKEEKAHMVFQIGTSDEHRALKVLQKIQDDISGIDVNMGCPKPFSIKGGMGAALLKKPDKMKAILTTLVQNSKVPVTCKIRVLSTIEDTLKLALLIQSCGVSALAIHGRNVNERRQHPNRNHFIKAVAEKLDIPVIANGGSKEIKCFEDIRKFKEETGASSVMLARAAEQNFTIFRAEGKLDLDTVIKEYLKLSLETRNPFPHTKYTIQHMLRELQETPRGKEFLATATMEELCEIWGLGSFYRGRQSEWDEFHRKKLEINGIDEADEDENPNKKPKLDLLLDPSITIVPDCHYIRNHYDDIPDLPKTVLLEYCKAQPRPQGMKWKDVPPTYTTEYYDKKFISIVEINGRKWRTDVWEKNKKCAEQGAALACCRDIKLMK